MTKLRAWSTAFIAAVLSISVLVGAGPVQAGEVCAKQRMLIPTPKSLGLGSGWKAGFAFNKKGKATNARKCRYADSCPMVIWMKPGSSPGAGAMLQFGAFEVDKAFGKDTVKQFKRLFKSEPGKKRIIKSGKTLTFALSQTIPGFHDTSSISIRNYQRLVALELTTDSASAKKYAKALSLNTMAKKTQQLAQPCSGKLVKLGTVQPLQQPRNLPFQKHGLLSRIR